MSTSPAADDTEDGEILADLFDTLLQDILEGRTPDLANYHQDRPDLRERIQKTWALACSVAGRREPGRPVLGGYEIVRELGHGGMGTVYLARHQLLQREVAIKVLPHSLAMSPRAKQRFLEEAQALARVRHQHVVHIHRIIDQSEMLAFEMEFVAGPSLQSLIQTLQKSPQPRAVDTLAQALGVPIEAVGTRNTTEWCVRLGITIARALGEVHRHGLVHRDVKPSNVLLRGNGEPVIADFGLARFLDLEASRTGAFAGTPVYAAPERLRAGDADIDARADVYSLGVTLYELLALVPPFAGGSTTDVLRRIEGGEQLPLRRHTPHVSRDLETVIQKAMEADPQHRYATADAFADDLDRLLNLQPILARPAGPVRRALKFLGRHRRPALAACLGALLVASASWPVLAHARAAADAREQAAAAVLEARTHLLSPQSLQAAWSRAFAGTSRQPLQRPPALLAQIAALTAARDAYDVAIAGDPELPGAALERSIVAAALAILQGEAEGGADAGFAGALRALPPALQNLAQELQAAKRSRLRSDEIAAASTDERFAAGLLAFLLGDLATSHACWNPLADSLPGKPLFDACFALQLANDGYPERAYPRLFHAARVFPAASSIALAMAESSLAMGDAALAEHWLAALPPVAQDVMERSRRQLLAADLRAATGDLEAAGRAYRELCRQDRTDPTPVQRLAALALDQGDFDTAGRLLQFLLDRWPDLSLTRLELARLCLQRRDLPAYLDLVRHVLAQNLDQLPRGAAGHLLEIIRIGGLQDLHGRLLARHRLQSGVSIRSSTLPLASWLPPRTLARIEASIDTIAAFERATAIAAVQDPRSVGRAVRTAWHTALRVPALTFALPWRMQAAVLAGAPLLLGQIADLATWHLSAFQSSLGDRLHRVALPPLVKTAAPSFDDIYAHQLLRVPDVDGDTLDDLCIACPAAGRDTKAARIEIRSLDGGALLRSIRNDDDSRAFGRALCTIGDIDGDGCEDLVVGAPQASPGPRELGEVQLRSGRTGARLWTVSRDIASFGVALAALGDVDGDGHRDFVVGCSPRSLTAVDRGRAWICSGRNGGELRELAADRSGSWFGAAVANVGDVDRDGMDDVLVTGNYGGAPGFATLFSARTGSARMSFGNDVAGTEFGYAAIGVGDIDGDDCADFAISAPALSGRGKHLAKVQVIGGKTGTIRYEISGEHMGDGLGISLCWLPSWRDDTGPVLALGANRGGPVGNGYVRIYRAADGRPIQTFAGSPALASFAHALTDLGDLEGDGLRNLGIGCITRQGHGFIWQISWALVARDQQRGR